MPNFRVMAVRNPILLTALLWLCIGMIGYAQPPDERHTPFALKTQAYPTFAHLVQPLIGGSPFVHHYITGAAEVGFGDRHAVEFRIAARYRRGAAYPAIRNNYFNAAYPATWAYRNYLRPERWGRMAGPYWSAALTVGSSNVRFACCEDIVVNAQTRLLAVGGHVGWQLKLWKHLLIDAGMGPQAGYQIRTERYGRAFALDHVGFPLWERYADGYLRYLLLGVDASVAIGWLF